MFSPDERVGRWRGGWLSWMKRKRFFEELMVDVFVGRDVAVGDAAGDLTVVRLIL